VTATAWDLARTAAREDPLDEITGLVHRLSRTLSLAPGEPLLLQALVLDFPARFSAGAAMLARCRNDGSLVITSWFGVPAFRDVTGSLPVEDGWPLRQALRTSSPLVWPTAAEVATALPAYAAGVRDGRPLAAAQLATHGAPSGVVAVAFDDEVDDREGLARAMGATRDILSAYLGLLWSPRRPAPQPVDVPTSADQVSLTQRQTAVLSLMSEGMSNRQISMRIGYSESTVRHETMAIYRVLGVGDRHAASRIARELGLVD
jgi:DNA-binding CsgD family transcriptional regulator